jgi:L-fuculose-phosphate aldolase
MLLAQEREQVVAYGKKLVETGLTEGTFGNLSVLNRKEGLMAISPSGMDYFLTRPEDVAVVDLAGVQVDGAHKPSSEVDLHRLVYQARADVNGVVHTHSSFATILSCLRWSIPPIHYLVAYSGREVPCIPYYPFGSVELAEAARDALGQDFNVCLLGNHGLLAAGGSLSFAFDAAQQIEFLAKVYYHTRMAGGGVPLTPEELDGVLGKFQHYRQA